MGHLEDGPPEHDAPIRPSGEHVERRHERPDRRLLRREIRDVTPDGAETGRLLDVVRRSARDAPNRGECLKRFPLGETRARRIQREPISG